MNTRNKIRLLAVLFSAVALLMFSTAVVSDWDCHSAADDTRCPYCHLTHQAPAPQQTMRFVAPLEVISSVPLSEDVGPSTVLVLSETPPRAPPAA
jgi:hypothetical protein